MNPEVKDMFRNTVQEYRNSHADSTGRRSYRLDFIPSICSANGGEVTAIEHGSSQLCQEQLLPNSEKVNPGEMYLVS